VAIKPGRELGTAPKSKRDRARVLLLCDDWAGHANTVLDHIDSFRLSRHKVKTFNPKEMSRSIALNLNEFDAVVIHYSLLLSNDRFVSPAFRDKLRRYRGPKIQFIQDDYRWVNQATQASRDVGVQVLFTAVREPAAAQLYEERLPGVRRVQTLTGYVPDSLLRRPLKPLHERTIDVGYRGREVPFWLGRLTQEKKWIGQEFLRLAPAYGLKCDIGWREEDRIYGGDWVGFIANCRATLAAESGASIADFDGSIEDAVRTYLLEHPDASFEDVHEAVLRPYEGNVVANVISPRVFEAAALGTALVMFPGEYSGMLIAGEDYIRLAKDFSNMDEVVTQLKDDDFLTALTQHAYEHLVASGRWSYAAFIQQFDGVVSEEASSARYGFGAPRHRLAKIERVLRVPPPHVRLLRRGFATASALTGRHFADKSGSAVKSVWHKSTLALRAAIGDAQLRPIYREGRRAGMAVDSLLDEILKLSVLRSAASGKLRADDRFAVVSEFDAADGSLRFVSQREDADQSVNGSSRVVRDALLAGSVKAIEWDHRAMGPTLWLRKPRVELVIGKDGFKSFTLLAQIGQRKPALIERALRPIIGMHESGKRSTR
jgi:hypothetical protein